MNTKSLVSAVAGAVALAATAVNAQEAPVRRPPTTVTVAQVSVSSLPYEIETIGSVQAIASIQMRSRVDAQVESIAVPDGRRDAVIDADRVHGAPIEWPRSLMPTGT